MTLLQGESVGHYVIESFLGAGGMGQVYRAYDPRLERQVALKVVWPGDAADTDGRVSDGTARLLREARAVAALDHPNVVGIYDVGQIDTPGPLCGTTFIAMELVKGESLRAYVGDENVPMEERVRWLGAIASALAAAHRAGIVHRDVKPENVMVRHDGLVKVLDFGIAKRRRDAAVDPLSATEQTTGAGVVLGTPLYMAPEQLRAEPLDARADQFAWGVLAYELLSGRPPWTRGKTSYEIASQILHTEAERLDEVAGVPPLVAASVTRAMRKEPSRRFESMDALMGAMSGVLPPRVSEPPPVARTPSHQTEQESIRAPAVPKAPRALPSVTPGGDALPSVSGKSAAPRPPRRWRASAMVASAIFGLSAGAILLRSLGASRGAP
ncbi:MAG TPA: serine/threonine-protein kinase, partial [Polyangiaceae bacterium]